jgi:hypothetical protein
MREELTLAVEMASIYFLFIYFDRNDILANGDSLPDLGYLIAKDFALRAGTSYLPYMNENILIRSAR